MDRIFKYDVAISFLAEDESLAVRIADSLRDRMSVFVYSEQQKDLAGKDGQDVFSAVFRNEARVCVVLFRDGWGTTKWTGVEQTAIKDRAFEEGWDFLTVIGLSKDGPVWLPKTKIWLGYERFGLVGATTVIDARVKEQGGETQPETARNRAERLARIQESEQERETFLFSERGVAEANAEIDLLFQYLEDEVAAIRKTNSKYAVYFSRRYPGERVCAISSASGPITLGWSVQYANSLRQSNLLVQVFPGHFRFDGGSDSGRPFSQRTFLFARTLTGENRWEEKGQPLKQISTPQFGEDLLKLILDRIHSSQPRRLHDS